VAGSKEEEECDGRKFRDAEVNVRQMLILLFVETYYRLLDTRIAVIQVFQTAKARQRRNHSQQTIIFKSKKSFAINTAYLLNFGVVKAEVASD